MKPIIDQQTLKQLRKQFLGKKISVENHKGRFVGTCQFIGPNEFFPSYELQATLDRMPVTNVKIKSIIILEDQRIFKDGK